MNKITALLLLMLLVGCSQDKAPAEVPQSRKYLVTTEDSFSEIPAAVSLPKHLNPKALPLKVKKKIAAVKKKSLVIRNRHSRVVKSKVIKYHKKVVHKKPTVNEDKSPRASSEVGYSVWDRLAQCESTGNWSINTGNGFYGGLQFTASTWLAYGGGVYSDRADHATRSQQIAIAIKTQASQGWGAWPACSSKLGLR